MGYNDKPTNPPTDQPNDQRTDWGLGKFACNDTLIMTNSFHSINNYCMSFFIKKDKNSYSKDEL